jgi:peroxiredoxin-like protein
MDNTHYYEVDLQWENGRKGKISSPVLEQGIEVATPPEFQKGLAGIWSPEHLLVAAVNSCLMTTFLAIADNSRLNFTQFSCQAVGKLEKVDNAYLITEVLLKPYLTITSEEDRAKSEKILHKAEAACLISNSVKSRVTLEPTIIVSDPSEKTE